jgi:hypothetical protein
MWSRAAVVAGEWRHRLAHDEEHFQRGVTPHGQSPETPRHQARGGALNVLD